MDPNPVVHFFPESHTYTINGRRARYTASAIVKRHFPPFVPKQVISKCIHKWNAPGSTSEYKGKSERQIMAMWKQMCNDGTRMHAAIEQHVSRRPVPRLGARLEPHWPLVRAFLDAQILRSRCVDPTQVYCEHVVASPGDSLAGTIDCAVLYTSPKTGKACWGLIDWKFSKQDYSPRAYAFGQPTTTVAQRVFKGDSAFNKVTLQLNAYAYMFKQSPVYRRLKQSKGVTDVQLSVAHISADPRKPPGVQLHHVPVWPDSTTLQFLKN